MDSLTQVVLGAVVAEAAIGRSVGRRAALCGAALGTLPDLDVFVSFGGVVEDFVYHRGASHSLLVLTLLSPVLAWLIHRFHGAPRASYRQWLLAVWFVLITHPLLDALTIYGTQLWWPVTGINVLIFAQAIRCNFFAQVCWYRTVCAKKME